MQAERSIWSFGYDAGLTDEGVPPSLTRARTGSGAQAVISGMDFDALAEPERIPGGPVCPAYDPIIWGRAAEPPKLHFHPA